jgi:hypothetical protein
VIKDLNIGGKGTGGLSQTGPGKPDSSASTLEAGVTEQTKGGDPYTAHKPGAVPGHMAQLKTHSGGVAKGGDSQAGSVGGYEG